MMRQVSTDEVPRRAVAACIPHFQSLDSSEPLPRWPIFLASGEVTVTAPIGRFERTRESAMTYEAVKYPAMFAVAMLALAALTPATSVADRNAMTRAKESTMKTSTAQLDKPQRSAADGIRPFRFEVTDAAL